MRQKVLTKSNTCLNLEFLQNNKKIGNITIVFEHKNVIRLWAFNVKEPNQGWGGKILKKIIRKFKRERIYLYVYKTNSLAIHLYKKFGFRIIDDKLEDSTYNMVREIDNTEG